MEIINKNIKVKYKEFSFNIKFELQIFDRIFYKDVPNLTEEIYWNHAVNVENVGIFLNDIKINSIISSDVSEFLYSKIMKIRERFIKSKLKN